MRDEECFSIKEKNSTIIVTEKNSSVFYLYVNNMLMKIEGGFVEALEVLVKFQLLMKITISTDLDLFFNFIVGCLMKRVPPIKNCEKLFKLIQDIQ